MVLAGTFIGFRVRLVSPVPPSCPIPPRVERPGASESAAVSVSVPDVSSKQRNSWHAASSYLASEEM